MNLTNLSNLSVEEQKKLVEERFLPAMRNLAEEHGMEFSERTDRRGNRIASGLKGANICFRKPSWKYCYIYFEFLEKDWCNLQYGCGYWRDDRIKEIDDNWQRLKTSGRMGFQKTGGGWSCKKMGRDEYLCWGPEFFRDLVENESKVVSVFREKLEKMLDIVKEFEHIL
jgi:hypothetical protein